jgi:hypothetical protein
MSEPKQESPVFSWHTEAGREAKYKLTCWGMVQQERASGVLYPKVGGGGTGGVPNDMPDIFAHQMDVDMSLQEWDGGPFMHRLLLHIYRDGLEFVPYIKIAGQVAEGMVEYLLWGGQTIQLHHDEEPPKRYAECRYEVTQRVRYRLDEFYCPDLDTFLRSMYPVRGRKFYKYRRRMLERAHLDFAEFMARRRNLGETAQPTPEETPVVKPES